MPRPEASQEPFELGQCLSILSSSDTGRMKSELNRPCSLTVKVHTPLYRSFLMLTVGQKSKKEQLDRQGDCTGPMEINQPKKENSTSLDWAI